MPLQASVQNLSPEQRDALRSLFGPQIAVDGQTAQWKAKVSEYARTTHDSRSDARRVFTRSAGDLLAIRPADDASEATRASLREVAGINAVEISAVAAGRKPLSHEDYSAVLSPAAADQAARGPAVLTALLIPPPMNWQKLTFPV